MTNKQKRHIKKEIYKRRNVLFNKLKDKGVFWSFSKNITCEIFDDDLFIEYTLKYGDFDDIKEILRLFGKDKVKKVWEKNMMYDKRFIKVNLLIARVFFSMDIESTYFEDEKHDRVKKFRLPLT